MSTPGRRKALRALAKAKRKNVSRIAAGKKPVVNGKQVSLKKFARQHPGAPSSKAEARKRKK